MATSILASAASFKTLQTTLSSWVLTVTINNTGSEVNLFNQLVLVEPDQVTTSVKTDASVKVIVYQSDPYQPGDPAAKNLLANVLWNITQLPQATIAVIDGPARGAANEFAVACDMRFASNKAVLGAPEAGITTAAGEKYGWINKALDSSDELYSYVKELAHRIALFPREALVGIKASIDKRTQPSKEQIFFNANQYLEAAAHPEVRELFGKLLVLSDGLTNVEFEKNLGEEGLQLYN
ncbi:hypothetical protein NLG97_g3438 [Lecanicillium saksenae]|uniref:Uncharacterized protein n=1 Tax=Lecanicillium saksenae TaxID=468837 RepID=A0ACC1R1E0_9HYPO|nr:hypothetical protein NLG97_g3438 [Lecanicillium saksenae]